jgi:hypothetical protein
LQGSNYVIALTNHDSKSSKTMRKFTRLAERFLVGLSLSALLCTSASADILDKLMWGALGAVAVGAIHEGVKSGCQPVKDLETGQTRRVCKKAASSSGATQSSAKEPPVDGATPGRETKGPTTQWEKDGGMEDANRDFDSMNPGDVMELPNGGRRGTLPNGRKVVVRPDSTDGRPTLEIQNGKKRDKVRYGK